MKRHIFTLAMSAFLLGACTGPVIMGSDAAVIMLTRPSTPPPADTESQIPEHESWCYSTMAEPQCYPHPQDVHPSRLINVEPQSRYPLDAEAYRRVVAERMAATTPPTVLAPVVDVPVETQALKKEMPPAPPAMVATPAPKEKAKVAKKKKAKAKKHRKPHQMPTPIPNPETPTN